MDGLGQVWVVDANPIFRRGLIAALEGEGLAVTGESETVDAACDLHGAEVLLFELERDALAAATAVGRDRDVRLVAVVSSLDGEALDAVAQGLEGIVCRSTLTPRDLGACVRAVLAGQASVPRRLLGAMAQRPRDGAALRRNELAARELSVLRLLAEGGSTRDIAERLAYSERTVKNIVHDLLVKLDCHTRAHAVARATRQGVI